MRSLAGFNFSFTPNWRMSLLAFFAILLFLSLGFWQIQRADEKKQMLMVHQAYDQQQPMVWQPGSKPPEQYQQVKVEGSFLPQILLLDNQHYHHHFGYHVISPLRLMNGQVVLVDRGWIAGDITRQTLPTADTPTDPVTLVGSAYYPSEKSWLLGSLIEKEQTNIAVVELVDTALISQFLHKSVYPFMIRLGKQEANGYKREWAIIAMPPQRHYAYALQWFGIALIVLILFVVLNIKKTHENCSS